MQSLFDFSTPIPDMFIVTTGTLSKEYILYGQKPKDCNAQRRKKTVRRRKNT